MSSTYYVVDGHCQCWGPCSLCCNPVQGSRPHNVPLMLCHLIRALSSQPSRAPGRHSLHHQKTQSPPLHSPHPSFKALSSLHHQGWLSKQWSASSSFSIPSKALATTTVLSPFAARRHSQVPPPPLNTLTVYAIPGCLSPQPPISRRTKKHQPVMVN